MDGWMAGWMDGWAERSMNGKRRVYGWMISKGGGREKGGGRREGGSKGRRNSGNRTWKKSGPGILVPGRTGRA